MLIPLDIVWPAMAMAGHPIYWAAISAGVLVEWPFIKAVMCRPWVKSIAPTVIANAASSLIGVLAIPAIGALWEIGPGDLIDRRLGLPTFNDASWAVTCVIVIALNVLIEGAVLARWFHARVSAKNAGLLLAANALSVGLAFWAASIGRA
jgi:hypothetical protein